MKRCPYCLKEDLHDKAKKCHHCGAWLSKIRLLGIISGIVAEVFIVIFILALTSCGLMVFHPDTKINAISKISQYILFFIQALAG